MPNTYGYYIYDLISIDEIVRRKITVFIFPPECMVWSFHSFGDILDENVKIYFSWKIRKYKIRSSAESFALHAKR